MCVWQEESPRRERVVRRAVMKGDPPVGCEGFGLGRRKGGFNLMGVFSGFFFFSRRFFLWGWGFGTFHDIREGVKGQGVF